MTPQNRYEWENIKIKQKTFLSWGHVIWNHWSIIENYICHYISYYIYRSVRGIHGYKVRSCGLSNYLLFVFYKQSLKKNSSVFSCNITKVGAPSCSTNEIDLNSPVRTSQEELNAALKEHYTFTV